MQFNLLCDFYWVAKTVMTNMQRCCFVYICGVFLTLDNLPYTGVGWWGAQWVFRI